MRKLPAAHELESLAVKEQPSSRPQPAASCGEAIAMLVRRGFQPLVTQPDLPFPQDLDSTVAERLADLLSHYAFRLFLRGAIQKPDGFVPGEATRYLDAAQAQQYARQLVALGIAASAGRGRYRLLQPVPSFGGTLEWYVARELRHRFCLDVASGVKLQTHGVGGDFDIIAAGEGKLIYVETKSSPPKNVSVSEIAAFFDRLQLLRPDIGLFVVDTALRLEDKVVPMLIDDVRRRQPGQAAPSPRELAGHHWAVTPHLYAVNGRRDLMANIGTALAEGLRELAPPLF